MNLGKTVMKTITNWQPSLPGNWLNYDRTYKQTNKELLLYI